VFLFILRRLLQAIPILILASVLTFVLVTAAGDPLAYLKDRPNAEVAIANRKVALGLDRPAWQRYTDWATGLITGDFGKTNAGRDVWPIVWNGLTITLRLVLAAAIIAVVVGVIVGVFSAIRQYSAFDYSTTFLSFLFFAMPVFWFAVLLKQYGAISFNDWLRSPSISTPVMVIGTIIGALVGAGFATLGPNRGNRKRALIGAAIGGAASLLVLFVMNAWFDGRSFKRWIATVGPETPNFQGSFLERAGDWLGHMLLPTIALAAISYATYSRFQRASMLDTLSSDYVRTARAKGLSERRVITKHAFRTALIPVVTLVALDFGAILGGAIITENVFAWSGMGTLLRQAVITDIDPYLAMGVLMVTAIAVIIFNILADIAYAYLDPRIRLD
jgi:peptide/nickel transport system permease protein